MWYAAGELVLQFPGKGGSVWRSSLHPLVRTLPTHGSLIAGFSHVWLGAAPSGPDKAGTSFRTYQYYSNQCLCILIFMVLTTGTVLAQKIDDTILKWSRYDSKTAPPKIWEGWRTRDRNDSPWEIIVEKYRWLVNIMIHKDEHIRTAAKNLNNLEEETRLGHGLNADGWWAGHDRVLRCVMWMVWARHWLVFEG